MVVPRVTPVIRVFRGSRCCRFKGSTPLPGGVTALHTRSHAAVTVFCPRSLLGWPESRTHFSSFRRLLIPLVLTVVGLLPLP